MGHSILFYLSTSILFVLCNDLKIHLDPLYPCCFPQHPPINFGKVHILGTDSQYFNAYSWDCDDKGQLYSFALSLSYVMAITIWAYYSWFLVNPLLCLETVQTFEYMQPLIWR